MANDGITLATVLEHMQNMQRVLTEQMQSIQKTMATKDDLQALNTKVDRHYRNFMGQLDAVDDRLGTLEIEQLPKRVTRLEEAVGIGK